MLQEHWLFFIILIVCVSLSIVLKKLTVAAALTGGAIACCIFIGAGFTGIIMLAIFFILGSAATSWKMDLKQRSGFAEKDKGRRSAGQVIANSGVAAITGLLIWIIPANSNVLLVIMAASFASAMADTLSSELGFIYGKKFFNILTFKKDKRGLDGVISIEGTAIGIIGSVIIALIHAISYGWNKNFLWIIIAGTIGNLTDSVLGATFERKNILGNNTVNFLNTLVAALVSLLFYVLL